MSGKCEIEILMLCKQPDRIIGIDAAIEDRKRTGSNERIETISISVD